MSDTTRLVKKTDVNGKISEIEGKMPSICGLVTNSALTAGENTILDVSNLVQKTDYDAKVSETKIQLLIMIITNTLLLQNFIS